MKYKQILAECEPSQTHQELNQLLLKLKRINIKTSRIGEFL